VTVAVEGGHTCRGAARLAMGTQVAPERTKPALQVKSQVVPLQVAVPLATDGQGEHDVPQAEGDVLSTQSAPQRW
jgi:hypothetical protein